MPKRLSDLDVVEVSLVPKGANRKKFLLMKEVNGMDMEELYKIVMETELEDEDKVDEVLKAELSDKAANAVKGALRLLNAYKDELPKNIIKTLADLIGYGYPEPAEKAKKDEEEYGYPKPKVKKEDGSLDLEAIPEEVRPAIEALWKEHEEAVRKAEELEARLQEERDRQLTKEFVAKAAEFRNLSAKPDDLGPVLKRISELSAEDYGLIESVLKAADEALEGNRLLEEIGSGMSGGEIMGEVEGLAQQLVQKDGLTHEQAVDRVLTMHPELYRRYLTERSEKK